MQAFKSQQDYDEFVKMLIDKEIITANGIDIDELMDLRSYRGGVDSIFNRDIICFFITLLNNDIDVFAYLNDEVPASMFFDGEFENKQLPDIVLPDRIKNIRVHAFDFCNIHNIVFPSSLIKIGMDAFNHNSQLCIVDLSNTKCKEIGLAAFYVCSNLKKVILPETIEMLGNSAFSGLEEHPCPLYSINFPKSLKKIDGYCFNCCSFTKLEFNEGLEIIGLNAFRGNKSLTEVILPTTLDNDTLNRIVDHNSFEYIFTGCDKLKTIYCKSKSQYDYLTSRQPSHKKYSGIHVPKIELIK